MASFSTSSFSIASFSENSFFFSGDAPVVVPPSLGGISPLDVRRYLDFIESLKRLDAKQLITPEIIEAAQAIDDLPIKAAQIEKIAQLSVSSTAEIDYNLVAQEISRIQEYLLAISKYGGMIYDYMQEQDDEITLLLLTN